MLVNNRRQFTGTLVSADAQTILLNVHDGEQQSFDYAIIEQGKLDDALGG